MSVLKRFWLKAAVASAIAGLALALAPPPASAQALYGSIVGTVSDQQGAGIPGATVTATNTGTGLKVDTVTSGDGAYAIRSLLPGTYDLGVSLQGQRKQLFYLVPLFRHVSGRLCAAHAQAMLLPGSSCA